MWRSRPDVSELVSVTSLSAVNSGMSVREFFANKLSSKPIFVKIGSVTVIMYVTGENGVLPVISLFLDGVG